MNNTTPVTVTSIGMAMISITEVQQITYIVIAVISLILTLVTAIINYKKDKKVNSDDLYQITHKLDDLKEHIDDYGKTNTTTNDEEENK